MIYELDKIIVDFSENYKFTKSQKKIFPYVVKSYTNKEIANRFGISERTVKFHLGRMFKRLKVRNRTALVYKVV